MFAVDTNVFVYAADRDAPEQPRCRRLLDEWRGQALPWATTWGVLYEFLRVATHPRVFRRPMKTADAWRFVEAVLASPALKVLTETSSHEAIASRTFAEVASLHGNLIHDAHIAVLMREHGVRRIYTRDSDFHRFPFVEVIDPLAE